ncbi:uncharacterized protein LOC110030085 [Phalaenopsis equestris]|uniref:uncharacterized protein LOC110030085 n=1 Tax=Phalaenopsis equestris TaxID=78828 RepID=UPI0009E28B7A|nr:uncharacterized protein LOC110030085 [Phalaenopsis equestris]
MKSVFSKLENFYWSDMRCPSMVGAVSMEIFYLLCSIASNFVSSSILSLLVAIQYLSRLLSHPPANERCSRAAVRLYEGRVSHVRTKPVFNSFEYPVRYALFDLDRTQYGSHLSADRAREVAGTDGPVFLLTIPTSVGYNQNPLKVYYCYNLGEEVKVEERGTSPCLKKCIAEVTNTPWGEKVLFDFIPGTDMVAKPLHVSPFMDMMGNWTIHADEPGENLLISISVQHPTLGNYFIARLSATKVHSSTTPNLELYFWLMPHKVAALIYWQAVKLWWKNVPFIGHPKYSSPSYRDVALSRDNELCPLRINGAGSGHLNQNSNCESRSRWCVWRDAEWPWA